MVRIQNDLRLEYDLLETALQLRDLGGQGHILLSLAMIANVLQVAGAAKGAAEGGTEGQRTAVRTVKWSQRKRVRCKQGRLPSSPFLEMAKNVKRRCGVIPERLFQQRHAGGE